MCPLCQRSKGDLAGNVCPFCHQEYWKAREATKKNSEILPKAIMELDRLRGYHAWFTGKLKQLGALRDGKSDEEAEAIGFREMEKAAQEERERQARSLAHQKAHQDLMSRLFPTSNSH